MSDRGCHLAAANREGQRVNNKLRLVVMTILVVTVAAGAALAGAPLKVPPVCAACAGVLPQCQQGDDTLTSRLDVSHTTEAVTLPVEPDDGETISITAVWATPYDILPSSCQCQEVSAQASATVTWTGNAWSLSTSGTSPLGPIFSISLCAGDDTDSCTDGDTTHSWAYSLIVDVARTNGYWCVPAMWWRTGNLHRVVYTTTSVDDGDVIDETCAEAGAVSPTSQSWSATDYGPWECAYDCDASGASMGVLYD
jgi:hypothetical protein